MPLRYPHNPIGAVLLNRGLFGLDRPSFFKPFHTSRTLRDDPSNHNHYETLKVSPDASHAEIKKSFYNLSKLHHPDVNPQDPHAARARFHRISEAYSVLGHAEKRARYDRDFHRRHPHYAHAHGSSARHKPTYSSSSNPAGGRPASGLSSRRRGTFQGPPPSFFRQGGWGSHSAKRRAAHEETTGPMGGGSAYNPETNTGTGTGTAGTWGTGGMGHGQRPYPSSTWQDNPRHFDKEGHERTHRRADERRAARQAQRREERRKRGYMGEDGESGEEGDMGRVAVVSGVIIIAVVGPAFLIWTWRTIGKWASGGGGKKEMR